MNNVKLNVTRDALKAFAEEAVKRGTGARALRSIFERIMLDIMYEIPSRRDVEMVTITRQAVTGEKPPTIKKRRPDNTEDAA
jgi:ATP-dependent Clp protease ATP-binding subunit ClpX